MRAVVCRNHVRSDRMAAQTSTAIEANSVRVVTQQEVKRWRAA
jgi:hypothetical protein